MGLRMASVLGLQEQKLVGLEQLIEQDSWQEPVHLRIVGEEICGTWDGRSKKL